MIANYHGHTMHCKHGNGSIRDHIEAAINFGLEEVAITEHVPIKNKKLSRIDFVDFENYMNELNGLKVEYSDQIKVLTGLECEYIPQIMDEHLFLKQKYDIDFLILGHHFSSLSQPGNYYFETSSFEQVSEYIENTIAGIKSGYFSILAHPDLFLNRLDFNKQIEVQSRRLLECCQEQGIVVEINGNGLRNKKGYPNPDFWKVAAEYDLKVVVNADSHAPLEINDSGVKKAYELANNLDINIIERLEF